MKKIISLFLAITIILFAFPVNSFATDYDANVVVDLCLSKVGTSYANGYCLAFVKDMFKEAYGFTSTACCAYKYGSSYIDDTSRTNIPLGASVFFGGSSKTCGTCGSKCGHIGIYVGNDYIVHAWSGKIVKYKIDRVINAGYPYRGWGYHGNYKLTDADSSYTDIYDWTGTFKVKISGKTAKSQPYGSSSTTRVLQLDDTVNVKGYVYNDYNNLWYYTDKGDYIYESYLQAVDYELLPLSNYSIAEFEVMCSSKAVRGEPVSTSEQIDTIYKGDIVKVIGYLYNKYGNLLYELDNGGFVFHNYLKVKSSEARMPSDWLNDEFTVKASEKTARNDPYASSDKKRTVVRNDTVKIQGYLYNKYGNLWYLTNEDDYLHSSYLYTTSVNDRIPSNYESRSFEVVNTKVKKYEPYDVSGTDEIIYSGSVLNTIGYVYNLFGNKWYECDDGLFVYDSSLQCKHVYENGEIIIPATCCLEGTKKYVCKFCDEIYTETIPKNTSNHTGGTTVKNIKTATCIAEGYTGDTYCLGCNTKIKSGVTTAKNASNHTGGTTVKNASDATCKADGYTGDTCCSGCGTVLSQGKIIPKTEHKYVVDNVIEATCQSNGMTVSKCTVCGDQITEVIPEKGHSDKNGDGKCDDCGKDIGSTTPGDPSENCSCNCHKGGFAGFIWKIGNLFNKIFKISNKRYCACGKDHYA